MKTLLLSCFLGIYSLSIAQTWSDDVAQIVYNKCSQCHHTGGVGPFPLVTYQETSSMAASLYDAVFNERMPPWPPDNNYQQYAHNRALSPSEKITMMDWLLNGTPEGTPANTPPPPVFPTGSLLGNGDMELQIPTYMSKATVSDDYVCFAMPSNLPTDRKIKAVEIVPGNREIVHHCLIYVDPTSSCVTDTIGGDCAGPNSANATLVMGYTPGSSPMTLPASSPLKLGMTMPANSQVIFAMHYPEGSYGEFDSTKVIFHFYPPGEPGVREVSAAPVLQNWSFVLPPNQHTAVSAQYPAAGGLPINMSILSVFPHMHLLGENMRVYGIKPNLDTLKFIWLPHWDFEWQDFYFFEYIQKADAGTTLYADGMFDNTTTNPHNPNNPPITVTAGLNTADEMFLVYAHYMVYLNGDENYNLDSLMQLSGLGLLENTVEAGLFETYPNPFHDGMTIYSSNVKTGDQISVYIYDTNGKLVRQLMTNEILSENELKIEWDGTADNGAPLEMGLYHISTNVNGQINHQRIVKH